MESHWAIWCLELPLEVGMLVVYQMDQMSMKYFISTNHWPTEAACSIGLSQLISMNTAMKSLQELL